MRTGKSWPHSAGSVVLVLGWIFESFCSPLLWVSAVLRFSIAALEIFLMRGKDCQSLSCLFALQSKLPSPVDLPAPSFVLVHGITTGA